MFRLFGFRSYMELLKKDENDFQVENAAGFVQIPQRGIHIRRGLWHPDLLAFYLLSQECRDSPGCISAV